MGPVVSLSIAVAQTRTVSGGAMVGYSGAHVATATTRRVATRCARYADGLPRSLSGRGAVLAILGASRWIASRSTYPGCRMTRSIWESWSK